MRAKFLGALFSALWIAVACGGTTPSASQLTAPSSVTTAAPQVLLHDDFNTPTLDTSKWIQPEGVGTFFGRTQIRPPSQPPEIVNGVLRLPVDTFNPTALRPGDSFWGAEIDTRQSFPVGNGIAFVARSRLVGPIPGGLVASVFSYLSPGNTHDEIDFELLTNDVAAGRVLTNVFLGDDFSSPGRPQFAPSPSLTDFNEFEIDWLPGRVQWKVNGQIVREETNRIPAQPMTVRLNFWVPDAGFAQAYNAALQPTSSAATNQRFFYEVDYVEVRTLTAPDAPVNLRIVK